MAIPDPANAVHAVRSAKIDVKFDAGKSEWTSPIAIDSTDEAALSICAGSVNWLLVSLVDPAGNPVDLSAPTHGTVAIGSHSLPTLSWQLARPTPGMYQLTLSINTKVRRTRASDDVDAMVFVYNEGNLYIESHLASYGTLVSTGSGSVSAVARLTDAAPTRRAGKVLTRGRLAAAASVLTANLDVQAPDGTRSTIPMHDDGLHNDGQAHDGVFGAEFVPSQHGAYLLETELSGSVGGVAFARTEQFVVPVAGIDLEFGGSAHARPIAGGRVALDLPVGKLTAAGLSVVAYAEVWGTAASGAVPVAWVSALTDVQGAAGAEFVTLELDARWIADAGAAAPFELRNVRAQDPDSMVPVATMATIPVTGAGSLVLAREAAAAPKLRSAEVRREMRTGPAPAWVTRAVQARVRGGANASAGVIVAVHGYCASVNPWAASAALAGSLFFLDSDANRGNIHFAEMVDAFAEGKGHDEYAVIGHSQGGVVGTTLHNFFWSGADVRQRATAGAAKLIQSVGSPYQGCTGAGDIANLGGSFGVGCGKNSDLSLDGAALWLPTISADTRAEVYYYTTTYKLGNLFGDSCSAAMNMVLEWPNDGVTELDFAPLPGGNNMGNTEKQCHTTEMNYNAQYYDEARNARMAADARG